MDDIQLAQMFVQRASLAKNLAELDKEIEKAVLLKGESVSIAGVKATYYKAGEGTPDYELEAEKHPDFKSVDLKPYTTVTKIIRWKDVCQALGIEAHGAEKPARVVIK